VKHSSSGPASRQALQAKPRTEQLLQTLASEFPRFRIQDKARSPFAHAIHWLLLLLSFGKQNRFLSEYHTVLGDTLLVSPRWYQMNDAACYILLRHERIHLQQRRRLTFPGMALVYLLPWFPIGLAYGRARLEWEAYVETLRATAEVHGIEAAAAPALRKFILQRFTGADYLWMWPFPRQLEVWYDAALVQIRAESLSTSADWPTSQEGGA
jgi:hypothetical protein